MAKVVVLETPHGVIDIRELIQGLRDYELDAEELPRDTLWSICMGLAHALLALENENPYPVDGDA